MYGGYRVWIRPSIGLISVEIDVFEPWEEPWWWPADGMAIQNPNIPFSAPNREVMAIDCLPLQVYHQLCYSYPVESAFLPAFTSVNLGAMVSWPHSRHPWRQIDSSTFTVQLCNFLEDCVELAAVQCININSSGWFGGDEGGVVIPNGWTRCSTHSVMSSYPVAAFLEFRCLDRDVSSWLSQANHIFKRLQITSNFRDYGKLSNHVYSSADDLLQ